MPSIVSIDHTGLVTDDETGMIYFQYIYTYSDGSVVIEGTILYSGSSGYDAGDYVATTNDELIPDSTTITGVVSVCDNGFTTYSVINEESGPSPVPTTTTATVTIRDQTYAIVAAIRGLEVEELQYGIKALVVIPREITSGIEATVAANFDLPLAIRAAIQGWTSKNYGIRAAMQAEMALDYGVNCAVAEDLSLPSGIEAAIQGWRTLQSAQLAAVQGAVEMQYGITAYILLDRTEELYLEMENLWPQECDLRSVPNWPSTAKDWRNGSLGS